MVERRPPRKQEQSEGRNKKPKSKKFKPEASFADKRLQKRCNTNLNLKDGSESGTFDKLFQLNVPDSMCSWITDFLTDRRQFMRLGTHVSDFQHNSTGSPQGCVLSPLLFSLYTTSGGGCTSGQQSVNLLKFADDTTLIGLISDGDEPAYRGEMDHLVSWCSMNSLELNSLKTVEMIVDFRKDPAPLPPSSSVTLQ
ncbi:hypothetical protein QTP70_004795 [Hemibagrus guttatus]|uniref:Reverse transcriptase domain-containing protein n=1 Tax=Hemibagrus guttatus TaxID=175788 RepID=A0AAE0V1C3_9TELE|nr:hypothetical protein QTP70_004795 [Hemibagrus guttatus]KAK3563939.1 hypothetical protein QTP86_006263 [Hemibagrus guttatus]